MSPHQTFSMKSFSAGLVALTIALAGCASAPVAKNEDACLKRRGAIDIGSGSTKAFAAVVDVCQTPKKIVERLFDEKTKISFGEAVEQSSDHSIPQEVVLDAAAKIAGLAEQMNDKKLDSIVLVATAAFRKASNGPAVAADISKAVDERLKGHTRLDLVATKVQILSQDEEADVGARSALTNLPSLKDRAAATEPTIVWDIGGGSMQMWSQPNGENKPQLFNGDLASVTFKNLVIHDIQKKDPAVVKSPNPLKKDLKKAILLARTHAKSHVPEFFKTHAAHARWIGIGGVHGISIQKQVEKESEGAPLAGHYTQAQLAKTAERRSKLTDEEIESEYRTTEVTNLALVLGYMQELKIDHVETVEASLTQGLIVR